MMQMTATACCVSDIGSVVMVGAIYGSVTASNDKTRRLIRPVLHANTSRFITLPLPQMAQGRYVFLCL